MEKSEFIKNVLDKFDKTLDGFEILSEKYSIPIEDIILISFEQKWSKCNWINTKN